MSKSKIQITLIKGFDEPCGFCMSVGDTIEFFENGFRRIDIEKEFYPNFGPYIQLQKVAEKMVAGNANSIMIKHFKAKIV